MIRSMPLNNTQDPTRPASRRETDEQRRVRVANEAELIAEARVELDAGLGIEDDHLEEWLDQLERDPDALPPTPQAGRVPARSF